MTDGYESDTESYVNTTNTNTNKKRKPNKNILPTIDEEMKDTEIDNQVFNKKTWDNYRYSPYDIDRMNNLIKKYSKPVGNNYQNKKRKIEQSTSQSKSNNDNNMLGWVSATRTKYFLLHDQSIDWLMMYYDSIGIGPEILTEEHIEENRKLIKDASHIDILFEGGNIFEKKIFEELANIFHNGDFVLVFTEEDMKTYREERNIDGMIREKNNYVKHLMEKGIPIIAQAPLINDNNKTFGVADLLIRSDYLKVLFKTFVPDKEINTKAPFLKMKNTNETYHYRVIDIKWTTMVLCVDGVTIRNEGFFPAYKGQLAVYTAALESLQGYIPNYAYIMPKAWRIDKSKIPEDQKHLYRGFSAFDRPGVIDYSCRDSDYLFKTKEAIQWVQRVMTEGREWRYGLEKPSVPELYPNLNKSFNPAYDKIKEELADRYGDPTMVWYVQTTNRDLAHSKGIYDVRDPRCTLDVLGISSGSNRGLVIEQILEINRHNQLEDLVRPKKIINNSFGWKDAHPLDYFVDFETINYNLFVKPNDMNLDNNYVESDVTFMIGIGFSHNERIDSNDLISSLNMDKFKCECCINIDKNKGWEFVCFHLVVFSPNNELEMFRMFYQFIIKRQELFKNDNDYKKANESYNNGDIFNSMNTSSLLKSRLFHWTDAELRFMRCANKRIGCSNNELVKLIDSFDKITVWIDMCKIFEQVPITVRGSFRFKLKHIGNAFCKNGLIDTNWDDGRMSNGFRAMLEGIKLYRTGVPMTKCVELYKEIIDYNEVDCRVVWEIVNYLRNNH
jgi:hypothetical protein